MASERMASRRAKPATNSASSVTRPRILLFEPDSLTRWSITTYLQRWFEVVAVESREQAENLSATRPLAALVLADSLPDATAAELQRRAGGHNPTVMTVRTIATTADSSPGGPHTFQLEKPFDLARLARLLGVPEAEVANASPKIPETSREMPGTAGS